MSSVIHMDVQEGLAGEQTIIMNVHENERGPQGEQGEQGEAATITAGNAYTVSADSQPAVMNTGTKQDAVFDFYIPRGLKGDPGKDGSIQYKAGKGIRITDDNVIYATGGGGGGGAWGEIEGNIQDQTDLQQEFAQYTKTANLATVATSGKYVDLTGKPSLATVATSGSYNDLTNKPTIPTVNNATLTIQNNGTSVGTFTANSATNTTVDIPSPTITVTNVDPGEGSPLAENHFVAVYGTNSGLLDLFYPVGSYYETSNTNFNPNTAWGGTWVEDTSGRVTVAYSNGDTNFGIVSATGGEKTHTLTTTEIPSHYHIIGGAGSALWIQQDGYGNVNTGSTTLANRANIVSSTTNEVGGSQAHNNLQPYVVVKRWHRTA